MNPHKNRAPLPDRLGALYKALKSRLHDSGIEAAELEARLILQQRAGVSWSELITSPDKIIAAESLSRIADDLAERFAGKPLSRIYGQREFWGLPFVVNQHVLDPRPDTETILDQALRALPDRGAPLRILDMGTGSGCILTALLHEYKQASGIGLDISEPALDTARMNADANGVGGRAEFIRSNWFDSLADTESFDLIVSNPPYIRESVIPELSKDVRNFDPILALDGGEDGLEPYKIIFSKLFFFLKSQGVALFEIGYDQSEDVMRLGRESRFDVINVHPDLAGQPRVVEIWRGDK